MKDNLKKALQTVRQGPFPLAAVFDLDSTLFCMKYRTEAILKSLLSQKPALREFAPVLKHLKVSVRDWAVEGILARYGLPEDNPLVQEISKMWRKCFFSDQFLHFDRPYKGAADYVQKMKALGADVFYLTGRGKKAMGRGSAASLKKWGFPLNLRRLILKEEDSMQDDQYKTKELRRIQKQFAAVLFFENEPVILNSVAKALPRIQLFWMDSAHSGREKAPQTALPIPMDYSL